MSRQSLWGYGLLLVLLGLVAWPLIAAENWIVEILAMLEQARQRPDVLLVATLVYVLCLAFPFMPSVELGLMMMLTFGQPGVLAAWLGTIAGLNLAYGCGAWLRTGAFPWQPLARLSGWLEAQAARSETLQAQDNWRGRILRWARGPDQPRDYLLLAILFNLPGNTLLGGGGGIALASGFSARLRWAPFAATTALATAALPLLVSLGLVQVDRWLGI